MNRLREGSRSAPEAAGNASRAFFQRLFALPLLHKAQPAVLILGLVGGFLLAISDFLTVVYVRVVTASCEDLATPSLADSCVSKGSEQHAWALLVLGLVALAMTYGAAVGRSRPAAAALLLVGIAALVIFFAIDLPDVTKTGQVGLRFSDADAKAGAGFWAELAGACLCILAGTFSLTRR
jgi:hypothetical protein